MPGLRDRLTDAGYGLGWSVVCRLPESWPQRGFRSAADLAWRRRGPAVQVLEGNLRRVIGSQAPDGELRALSRQAMRARALIDSSSSCGPGRAWIAHRGSRRRSLPLGEWRGMAARSLPPARTGQNGCSLGLPSGRVVARKAIGNHAVPGGAGRPRSNAVMPGQSIAAAAAISGAPDSNSCQVATMPLSRHSRHGEPGHRSLTVNRRPMYLDSGTAVLALSLVGWRCRSCRPG